MTRKAEKKQKDKSYVPKEFKWNPFLNLDDRAKKIPKRIIFALLFCLVSLFFLQKENRMNSQKTLGLQTQLQADQKRVYEWEKIVAENPNYRDGWLQISALYAKIGNKDKAQEALWRAKIIDPNNEIIPFLEKLLEE